MAEGGIDLSVKKPQSVFELFKLGRLITRVTTVCPDSDGKCPLFPGITKRRHWPFPPPAKVEGTGTEKLVEGRVGGESDSVSSDDADHEGQFLQCRDVKPLPCPLQFCGRT